MPSRRDLLATGTGALAALAGCVGDPRGTDERSPPDDSPGGQAGDRPTATPRSPEPLSPSGEWRQRGADPGHTGATGASGVPGNGAVHWHLRRVRSGPAVVAGDRIFHYAKLGEDESGAPTLTRTREPDAGTAHPVYGVPGLVARDASEGRIEWTAELPVTPDRTGLPAAGDGLVVASTRGWLGAFDRASGTEQWAHDLGDRPVGEPTVVGDAVVVPMSGISGGGDDDPSVPPKVRAYALSDGTERWTVEPPERGLSVAAAGDTAVVVSHGYDGSGSVHALALADGSQRWRASVPGNFFRGPVVEGGSVYVAGGDGGLTVLDLADGSERWSAPGGDDGLAVDGDAVYVAGDEGLVARAAADGSERWRYEPGAESQVPPAVAGDTVYAGGSYAGLTALSAADGSERWSTTFPTQVVEGDIVKRGPQVQPTVVDGAVYVFAADGLYAFGPA